MMESKTKKMTTMEMLLAMAIAERFTNYFALIFTYLH